MITTSNSTNTSTTESSKSDSISHTTSSLEYQVTECGPSLAESEWNSCNDDIDSKHLKTFITKQQLPPKLDSRLHGLDYHDGTSSTAMMDKDKVKKEARIRHAIESLRVEIASDIHSQSTFASPFESNDQHRHANNDRNNDKNVNLKVPLVYCDQTASNKPLESIENYLRKDCVSMYGNTHTNTSVTGSQSTAFCAEARQIVAEGVNARITGKAGLDVVLFAGDGATSTVEVLIDCLGLKHLCQQSQTKNKKPVVFMGPYEHHSNMIPWRESGATIITVPECPKTRDIDYNYLERALQSPTFNNCIKMGTFAAASNVDGHICDVDRIAATLHRHHALAFFDYATAAPYLPIDVNPTPGGRNPIHHNYNNATYTTAEMAKDAVFISTHKMLGGVGAPGILVMKRNIVNRINAPSRSGGGTVFYVTNEHHRFLSDRVERYEGGTPNIVGIWRAGLSFLKKRILERKYSQLCSSLPQNDAKMAKPLSMNNHTDIEHSGHSYLHSPPPTLAEYEFDTYRYVVKQLKQQAPNLLILGADPEVYGSLQTRKNLPILSFLIKCGTRFLHFNYVCAILNDLFGIQSRGGCQCAGPYSQRLLGLTYRIANHDNDDIGSRDQQNQKQQQQYNDSYNFTSPIEKSNYSNVQIERALLRHGEKAELLRPGFTRLSLPFKGLTANDVNYVLDALTWVAKHGWKMMCVYRCNHRTGEWRHFSRQGRPLGRTERRWLSHYDRENIDIMSCHDSKSMLSQIEKMAMYSKMMENATVQLKIATEGDRRHLSAALKMADDTIPALNGSAESKVNTINESMNDIDGLRWYIHPREVAKWISEDHSIPPGTNSPDVEGSIRPLGYFAPNHVATPSKLKPFNDVLSSKNIVQYRDNFTKTPHKTAESEYSYHAKLSDVSGEYKVNGMKRKRTEMVDSMEKRQYQDIKLQSTMNGLDSHSYRNISPGSSTDCNHYHQMDHEKVESNKIRPASCHQLTETALLSFRDGEEHKGEALLEDITAGYDDGELSERAEVFHTALGEWTPISSFLSTIHKNMSSDDVIMDTNISTTYMKKHNPNDVDIVPSYPSEKKDIIPTTKEIKKPARGPASWGKPAAELSVDLLKQSGDTVSSNLDTTGPADDNDPKTSTCSPSLSKGETNFKSSPNEIKASKILKPPPKMMRYITQAMIQWDMVQEGDRLLLGLSGGKDSLSLLHCLLEFQRKLPIKFEIEVCTIDPMTPSFDPSPLIPYVESLGLKYHYIRDDIVNRANSSGKGGKIVSSLCAFCARMKRGNLYATARKANCNKLVLAQHLDDCAESFLMSVMHNGFIRTMKAHYKINAGDVSVIRPLVYCREGLMTDFAKKANLPVINENCPACFEEPKERARIKKLLSREETLYPNFYDNIRRALIPIMHDDSTSILRCYTEEVVSKSRKTISGGPKGKNKNCSKQKRMNRENKNENGRNNSKDKEEKIESIENNAEKMKHLESDKKIPSSRLLSQATEEELIFELARRKAERHKFTGSMASNPKGMKGIVAKEKKSNTTIIANGATGSNDGSDILIPDDLTGQICTLDGKNGTIPCRELME